MDAPPVTMVVNPTAQWVITAVQFVAAALVTIWTIRGYSGRALAVRLLVLVGGGLSVLFEPFGDRLGGIWHAREGQWTLLTLYGHSVPLWMLFAYYWFCGGQTLFAISRIQAGATPAALWRLYWIFLAMDAVLEIPVLWLTDVYTYYGNQPFWWPPVFPLPGWYLVLNALLPLAAARAVTYLLGFPRLLLLIPVVMPMSIYAVYGATASPVWAAMNSEASTMTTYFAGMVTIALGLFSAHLLCGSNTATATGGS